MRRCDQCDEQGRPVARCWRCSGVFCLGPGRHLRNHGCENEGTASTETSTNNGGDQQ